MTLPTEENMTIEENSEVNPTVTFSDIIQHLVRLDGITFNISDIEENIEYSEKEKAEIAENLYESSKKDFLVRFGRFLKVEHLVFFEDLIKNIDIHEADELSTVLNKIKSFHNRTEKNTVVRNRRYRALQKLIDEGSYFSEKEMMDRNPLLYHQLVGRYLTEREKNMVQGSSSSNAKNIVTLLLDTVDRKMYEDTVKNEQRSEDMQVDEELQEEIEIFEDVKPIKPKRWGEFEDEAIPSTSKLLRPKPRPHQNFITAAERVLLREEFLQEMYSNFVDGKDSEFDYTTIDHSDDYDDSQILNRDEEDKYFDAESPEIVSLQIEDCVSEDGVNGDDQQENEIEDELDIYMNHLNKHHSLHMT